MKDIQEYINEAKKTNPEDITSYGELCVGDLGSVFCGNILTYFIEGVKEGMNKYKADDTKFQKRCEECIDKLLETINKDIY